MLFKTRDLIVTVVGDPVQTLSGGGLLANQGGVVCSNSTRPPWPVGWGTRRDETEPEPEADAIEARRHRLALRQLLAGDGRHAPEAVARHTSM